MSLTNKALHEQDQKFYLQTFKRYPLAFSHGEGVRLTDVEGKVYLDMLAGIAVNNVGYRHPKLVKALQEQADRLLHISNFFVTGQQVALSKRLVELSGLDRAFFTNSGAESVEGAIKIARKYAHTKNKGKTVISMDNCFHGRTLATIATGRESMQQGFDPIPTGFERVDFNDLEVFKSRIAKGDVGAIIIEPIQGEGGINVADKEFLHDVRQICNREDIVLIFDEVQAGIGRTGEWFAKDHFGVQPDIITLAKGLGGGMPVGAILANERVASAIDFGDHGTTFGGNPLACAAALAVLDIIEEENLLQKVKDNGAWFKEAVHKANIPGLTKFKGVGLMIGLEFDFETKPLVAKMMEYGVLANATAGNVLRLVPPLIINQKELQEGLEVIIKSVKELKDNG